MHHCPACEKEAIPEYSTAVICPDCQVKREAKMKADQEAKKQIDKQIDIMKWFWKMFWWKM